MYRKTRNSYSHANEFTVPCLTWVCVLYYYRVLYPRGPSLRIIKLDEVMLWSTTHTHTQLSVSTLHFNRFSLFARDSKWPLRSLRIDPLPLLRDLQWAVALRARITHRPFIYRHPSQTRDQNSTRRRKALVQNIGDKAASQIKYGSLFLIVLPFIRFV